MKSRRLVEYLPFFAAIPLATAIVCDWIAGWVFDRSVASAAEVTALATVIVAGCLTSPGVFIGPTRWVWLLAGGWLISAASVIAAIDHRVPSGRGEPPALLFFGSLVSVGFTLFSVFVVGVRSLTRLGAEDTRPSKKHRRNKQTCCT